MKGVVLNGPFLMLGKDVQSPVRKFAARVLCKVLPNFQVRLNFGKYIDFFDIFVYLGGKNLYGPRDR